MNKNVITDIGKKNLYNNIYLNFGTNLINTGEGKRIHKFRDTCSSVKENILAPTYSIFIHVQLYWIPEI